jgi:hypothetical protein
LSFGWLAAGQGYETSLLLSVELSLVMPVWRASVESRLKTLLEVALAHSGHRWLAHFHRLGDSFTDPAGPLGALVGLE